MSTTIKMNNADTVEGVKNLENMSQIVKNYEFYNDSLDEMQNKLKIMDSKFQMAALVLQNRNITDETLSSEKISSVIAQSKEISEENINMNFNEKNSVEILRFLEESLTEKTKTFRSKKLFIEHIRKIKETQQNELSKLFDKLNQVEDEYLVIEKALSSIQQAFQQNNDEIKNINDRVSFINTEKHKFEIEAHQLEEALQSEKNFLSQLNEEILQIRSKNIEYQAIISSKIVEAEQLQRTQISEQLFLYEQREKIDKIEKYSIELSKDMASMEKIRAKKESEFSSKLVSLKEALKVRNKSDEELKRIESLLAVIEKGEAQKSCFCDLNADLKNAFFEVIFKAQNISNSKQNYTFYEQMITEFILEKDVL